MTSLPQTRYLNRRTPPHISTLILIAGLAALSLNIFLPSLSQMAAYFGVPYATMQLSVSLYLASTAVLQIFIGPISDRFGRRPVMLVASAIFTAATIGAIVAPNFGIFLTCRLLQSIIATGFVLSRAVVRDMVAQDQAASMIGYVTMGMSVVPMIGPVIGGALDEAFGWQASFILLAVGGTGLWALVWADHGETNRRSGSSLSEQIREYPELLRSQRFWGYCLSAALASGAFFAYLGGAPFVGTEIFHLDPAMLGFYFGAPALGYMAGNYLTGRYSVRAGINRMILAGTILTTVGLLVLLLLALAGLFTPAIFFGLVITVGLGNGMMLPSANAGMLSVRPLLAGSAAGLGGAFTIGGGAILSAMASAMLGPNSGAVPLILLMLVSSALSILSILWVIRRERQLAAK
ncbi:MAG: Bcr/CflA family drug resistance efflux transporter [Cereibacter sphaeroides]|uniref:Bcr/CflA family efflux transporter n=1 Tax=Cereibacter sphaeroides TaxID=1063 RepID=A0A2W5URS7_CERSP|nr:MAG: Bcr/CflA family drug resistance efflux transporter [Cereibacter sphaeroides]